MNAGELEDFIINRGFSVETGDDRTDFVLTADDVRELARIIRSQTSAIPKNWTAKMHRAGVDAVKRAIRDWDCSADGGANLAAVDIVYAVLLAAPSSPAADEQDAARYRWLREQHWEKSRVAVVLDPKRAVRLGYELPSGERLDQIIDKARGVGK